MPQSLYRRRVVASLLLSGLFFGSAPDTAALAQGVPPVLHTEDAPYAADIADAAQRFGIPERWVRAVMSVESAGDTRAVSPAGAMGLMQVMPETWAGLRLRHRLGTDPFAPRDNILAGTAYLREMLDRYGNATAMLAAYNAGPVRYDEYLASGRVLPAETRAYVATLVPLLDGTVPMTRVAQSADWRDAALFVSISDAASSQKGGAEAARAGAFGDLSPHNASALFVPQSDR